MKKCPKCGTILDDSKKACYMCGTVLNDDSPLNFGDTFDSQIGATISTSQDNVFNNINSISDNNGIENVYSNGQDFNQNSVNSAASGVFSDQFNSLNSQQYDERTALEKIFSGDSRFKSKDEINEMENSTKMQDQSSLLMNNNGFQPPTDNMAQQPMMPPPVMTSSSVQNAFFQNNADVMTNNYEPKKKKKRKTKEDAQINWGEELKEETSGFKFKISLSFIFNTTCFILFIGVSIYVYLNYLKPKPNENVEFGGLVYSISPDFVLKTDDTFRRYYTKGENCAISIAYGTTNDVDTFVDDFFSQVKDEYDGQEGINTTVESLKINGNIWYELNVISLVENPASTGGYSQATKFKYVSMVYKGTYYDIRYVNLDNDGTCSSAYDKFIYTLAFGEE